MSLFGDASAFYVGLGWKVFPLALGSKLPAIKGGHGFKDATDDADRIGRWDRSFPRANIGIATGAASGILVVDIDPRNGGARSIIHLAAYGHIFPPGPEARTGNGGRHLFFAYEPGIRASKDRLGKGIDLKTDGGYVVGAPSIIAPSEQGPGGRYSWIRQPTLTLPRLPHWAVENLKPRLAPRPQFTAIASTEIAQRSLEGMARTLATASAGHRNNILNWAAYQAGALVRQGKLSERLVASRLTQAALAAGLHLAEVKATIASGLRGGDKPHG